MSGFDPAWLALREAADRRSRAEGLARRLGGWLGERAPLRPARIVDLGCGTGANVRFLSPLIGGSPQWTCIDDDERLLRDVCGGSPDGDIRLHRLDLVHDFDSLAAMPFDAVVCSALLDLVSVSWLDALVALVERRRAAVLFALNYDGRIELDPALPLDARVRQAFNGHQGRDKGFGPALGPRACDAAAQALSHAGHVVERTVSPWQLDARSREDAALLAPLVDGIAAAAIEQSSGDQAAFEAWRSLRLAQCAGGELRLTIGHEDVLGVPPPRDQ